MSADNYVAVKEKDGKWHVWMVLGGYDDADWKIPEGEKTWGGEFDNEKDAIKCAYQICREEVVEYGVVLLDYA